MTYGLGNVGNRAIEGLVLDFNRTGAEEAGAVAELSEGLYDFIGGLYAAELDEIEPDERPTLGFYIAGYSPEQPFPEEFEFQLPRDDSPVAVREPDRFGAAWRGIDVALTRIYKGIDARIIPWLREGADG